MGAKMTRMLWWALALGVALPSGAWAEKQDRVAVLQLRNTAELKTQEVDDLTDLVRGAALEVLPQARYLVMTNESILELLLPGTDLEACVGVGECEVETGRKLGARYLVTGDVLRFDGKLRVRLSLYETKTAQLMAQERVSGARLGALEGPIVKKSKVMFGKLSGTGAVRVVSIDPARGRATTTLAEGEMDFAALAAQAQAAKAQADEAERQRRELEAVSVRAQAALEAKAARVQAERQRRLDEAKWRVQEKATQDFAAIESLVETPTEQGAAVLKAWLGRYEGVEVTVEGMTQRVEVAEIARVKIALGPGGTRRGKAGVEWVRVEGGRFQMGSNHQVRVPTFYLAKTEVTVAQYRACVSVGVCTKPGTSSSYCNWNKLGRGDHPVNCVDWHQAKKFSEWAGGRLPSEAEWEYAARSGVRNQKYPWGNEEASCSRAVMNGDGDEGCGEDRTWPVCSKPGGNSAQGICDLAGNVWEWTENLYSSAGSVHVLRGGGWFNTMRYLRAASRSKNIPGGRDAVVGFRPAGSVP